MPRLETVREFIDKRSNGAWITFEINNPNGATGSFRTYNCISVDDFLLEYGRRSTYILDNYVVASTKESYPSNSQGQTIWMTVMPKEDYIKTLKPKELSVFEVEAIIKTLEKIRKEIDELSPEYNNPALKEIDLIIAKLED